MRGKLRVSGFDPAFLSPEYTIKIQRENFDKIAKDQLENTTVECTPGIEKLEKLKAFEEMEIHAKTWTAMLHHDFKEPTPVQAHVIPYVLKTDADLGEYFN
jgi:superfamily II DNA/RNA helicase